MLTDHQRKLWEAYEAAEGRAPRAEKLRALDAFLDVLVTSPPAEWYPWARSIARSDAAVPRRSTAYSRADRARPRAATEAIASYRAIASRSAADQGNGAYSSLERARSSDGTIIVRSHRARRR